MFKTIIELHGFDASEWGIQRTHTYSVCIFLERDINIDIDIYIYMAVTRLFSVGKSRRGSHSTQVFEI
jgi:hypothetical protein